MSQHNEAELWANVRKALSDYMDARKITSRVVENEILQSRNMLFGDDPPKRLVGHDTIDRFLGKRDPGKEHVSIHSVRILEKYLIRHGRMIESDDITAGPVAPLFQALVAYYGVATPRITEAHGALQ